MRYILLLWSSLLSFPLLAQAVINPSAVTIARDRWGVPHIFAKTDPEVAYGLAWAHAEDDFKTIQLVALPAKGLLGRHLGRDGAAIDYVVELLRAHELVEQQYDTRLSPEFKALIAGYLQGLNDYARAHPDEVLVKGLFPVTPKEYMAAVVLSLSVISGVDEVLKAVFAGKVQLAPFRAAGSNAFAISGRRTTDGQTYLAINSHQPLEGPVAWYEAHLCSEQGWNMLGGLFPGGPVIFHGVNENLGWAHTVNYQDKIDVYQLEMNPANDRQYRFDDQWVTLEEKTVRLRVKGLPIAVGRKAYWSRYGATVKTDKGVFAIRMGANMDLRGIEQWYRMNKARNFAEFYRALKMLAIPGFNIVYADRTDTIFYLSNGKMPLRNPGYNWKETLPGNTSKTLWTAFHPLSDLPQLLNPPSGFVFNTNNTPFNATGPADNLKPRGFDPTMGYERLDNNRSRRFSDLMQEQGKVSYEAFKRIKYDLQLPDSLHYSIDVNGLFRLNPASYPDISDVIDTLRTWNRTATADSRGAALFLLFYQYWRDRSDELTGKRLSPDQHAEGLRYAKAYCKKHFGRSEVTLGELQKLVRGDRVQPQSGIPDVLAAMHAEPYKNGQLKAVAGESYIQLVRFPHNGLPIIETVNCFGASNRPDSPHYADQMDLFGQQKTKPMTLDKATVLKEAVRVYQPGAVQP
ncbi:penicillin acylase family protein [Tellurirhabdus rosea]|uniref:penicillin acylase family protein n=1 Tax=Tellurirhabdus rosea TaxID=2674997 RepID=UPI002254731E|nr:acylase [Tellurirhabdus rosea]